MPEWVTALLAAAGVVTASSIIANKALKPSFVAIREIAEIVPVLREATFNLKDVEDWGAILRELLSQVRNNKGSSMLDIITETRELAAAASQEAVNLAKELAHDRQIAELVREEQRSLLLQQDRLTVKLDGVISSVLGVEGQQIKAATQLRESRQRADETVGDPGAAADAFAQSEPSDE